MEDVKQNNQTEKKTKLKKALFIVECVVILLCVILSVIVILQPGETAKNGTSKFLPVQTDSMTPTIKVGALVVTKNPTEDTYDLGTIVTFKVNASPSYLNTHRIVGYRYADESGKFKVEYYKKGEMETAQDFYEKYSSQGFSIHSYVTRGDKYTIEYSSMDDCSILTDPSVTYSDIDDSIYLFHNEVVRVYSWHIGGVGAVISWFMQPLNFFLTIIIPLILLFSYNVYGVVKVVIAMKLEGAKAQAVLDEEAIKKKAIEEYLEAQRKANNAPSGDKNDTENT